MSLPGCMTWLDHTGFNPLTPLAGWPCSICISKDSSFAYPQHIILFQDILFISKVRFIVSSAY